MACKPSAKSDDNLLLELEEKNNHVRSLTADVELLHSTVRKKDERIVDLEKLVGEFRERVASLERSCESLRRELSDVSTSHVEALAASLRLRERVAEHEHDDDDDNDETNDDGTRSGNGEVVSKGRYAGTFRPSSALGSLARGSVGVGDSASVDNDVGLDGDNLVDVLKMKLEKRFAEKSSQSKHRKDGHRLHRGDDDDGRSVASNTSSVRSANRKTVSFLVKESSYDAAVRERDRDGRRRRRRAPPRDAESDSVASTASFSSSSSRPRPLESALRQRSADSDDVGSSRSRPPPLESALRNKDGGARRAANRRTVAPADEDADEDGTAKTTNDATEPRLRLDRLDEVEDDRGQSKRNDDDADDASKDSRHSRSSRGSRRSTGSRGSRGSRGSKRSTKSGLPKGASSSGKNNFRKLHKKWEMAKTLNMMSPSQLM